MLNSRILIKFIFSICNEQIKEVVSLPNRACRVKCCNLHLTVNFAVFNPF
ncbi:hypothetical protein CKA32_005445 [Geitlerinema sp. FC II]|nr:hypothetical protein CKA32_005445 [Geitlerinema sp. FC II]